MTDPVFPKMDKEQDSKYYGVELEDPAMKSKMEGGYVVSRARHTRKPRKTFTTGYTGILEPDRERLETFYNLVRGGSVIFDWTDPVQQITYKVRFAEKIKFRYTGMGVSKLWDVSIILDQA